MTNPDIVKLLESLKTATMLDLIQQHGAAVNVAGAINEVLLQSLDVADQVAALAFTLAAIHAAEEDQVCIADKNGFVTAEDRLNIFLGMYHVAFNDAVAMNREQAAVTPSTETKH
jgi:hypothetical protein